MPDNGPAPAYCTNIHPGETWGEIRAALERHLPRVRECLDYEVEYFPIGLRLSAIAAAELTRDERERRRFADWMEEHKYEVCMVNGFPYGAFHGERVKEKVFLPDWSSMERLEYTKSLFLLLHEWARPGRDISVSTVPGSHKSFARSDDDLLGPVRELGRFLENLYRETGRDCHLGFEPEPFGQFDNVEESTAFLKKVFAGQPDEEGLRCRLGLTYDTCHFALLYEDASQALSRFAAEGIRLSRIQASNALALDPRDEQALGALARYDEPVYFHQVVVRGREGGLPKVFPDLPEALEWAGSVADKGEEWRCHFHIPIGASPAAPLRDTNDHLLDVIKYQEKQEGRSPHWEAETYTWQVLPEEMRKDMDRQIAGELNWLNARLTSA